MQPCNQQSKQKGFTLIELMVTVAIIAILAAIAIPSYRQFVKRNAESQVKAEMLNIATQLSSWRSKRLSYNGFVPRNKCPTGDYCYASGITGGVFVPLGSTLATHNYLINLTDSAGNALDSTASDGKDWRMVVESGTGITENMDNLYLDNTGVRCTYPVSYNGASPCTQPGAERW